MSMKNSDITTWQMALCSDWASEWTGQNGEGERERYKQTGLLQCVAQSETETSATEGVMCSCQCWLAGWLAGPN